VKRIFEIHSDFEQYNTEGGSCRVERGEGGLNGRPRTEARVRLSAFSGSIVCEFNLSNMIQEYTG